MARSEAIVPPWLDRAAALAWRVLVVSGAIWLLGRVLTALWVVVTPVVVAVLAATVLAPLADRLKRRRVPALLATWLVFAGIAAALTGVGLLIGPRLAEELGELGPTLDQASSEVQTFLDDRSLDLPAAGEIAERARSNADVIARGALTGVVTGLEVVAAFLLAVVLTFFFVKDGDRISNWFLGLLSDERARDAAEIGRRTTRTIGGYFRGVAVVGVVDAALIGTALAILDVPLVLPLAVITFFGAFFPFIGAAVAGLLAALVALVTEGWVVALIVVAVTVVIQQLEGDLLAPLLIGRSVQLHPVVIMLALTAGAIVGGVFGAFISIPLVASFVGAVDHFRSKEGSPTTIDGGTAAEARAES